MNRTILLVFTFAVIPFVAIGDESPKPLDKALISFRIGMGQTMSDSLPGYVASYHKMNLWIRQMAEGKLAAAVTNASFDEANGVELLLRTKAETIRVWDMDNRSRIVECTGTDGPYKKFVLPMIPPWEIRLIVTE